MRAMLWPMMARRRLVRLVFPTLFVLAGTGCARLDDRDGNHVVARRAPRTSASSESRPEVTRALEALRREETELRERTDFAKLSPSSRSLGSNPYAVVAMPSALEEPRTGTPVFAGVLRGDSAIVLLDAEGREVSRAETVTSPNGVAALADGRLFVSGDLDARVARFRALGSRLVADGEIEVEGASSLRGVVADERALFVADFWSDRLYSKPLGVDSSETDVRSQELCVGPIALAVTDRFVGAVCLFDHAVVLFERDAGGLAARQIKRITHDGPIWGLSLVERGDELFVAAGGVEDHPLDRRDKAFGYVDSFAFLYRLDARGRLERLFALNTSEHGVVTPKIANLAVTRGGVLLTVVGYASESWLSVEWGEGSWDIPPGPRIRAVHAGVPGCSAAAFVFGGERMLCANPLLDAWVRADVSGAPEADRVALRAERPAVPNDPSPTERLGEALFFTTLMAPDVTSAGKRSRFTCETCHFEGGTDGRVHHSGRAEIRVSTRPLLGLFNGAPHFSRAHDPDLTSVSHNEFRVANRGNPIDPWFALSKRRFPWLGELGVIDESLEPLSLRRALLVFLARFTHAENPLAVRRPAPRRFTDGERRGAELFRERCVGCHAARLVARDPSKEVPFERWEELVLSPEGPIVWSNGEYAKTGVLPYVDPEGTRTPSLRRLYLKRPYLTNGSARTLDALLSAARASESGFSHAVTERTSNARELPSEERRALLAFLAIL
jgi:hypothetical protein